VPHTDHDIDALAQALYNLSALRRDLQRFAGIEHAVGGLMVLSVVHRIGPARISDVAADMQVNLSVASRQIQALEDDGHVDRVPDPHDGRSSLIAISDAGRSKLERAHRRLVDAISTAVDDWDRSEISGLADGIVRLRAALGTCDDHHHLPADRSAADPDLTSAQGADAHHEEHTR
jgi:DNA-binding MarR family transcriptional regulator